MQIKTISMQHYPIGLDLCFCLINFSSPEWAISPGRKVVKSGRKGVINDMEIRRRIQSHSFFFVFTDLASPYRIPLLLLLIDCLFR